MHLHGCLCFIGGATVMRSDSGAVELIAAVQRCQAAGDTDGVYFCAAWLQGCGDVVANEALTHLLRDQGLPDIPIVEALRELARQRFDDLADWCLTTADLLDGGATPDPSDWLTALTLALRRGDFSLSAALHRVALADMTLMTCSDSALARNASEIRAYQLIRASLLARAADRN